jgi:hypothetical protein
MSLLTQFIQTSGISRTRRNHALEHATLRVLGEHNRKLMLAGYSDPRGFWIAGKVDTEELAAAVQEAQARLRAGEHELAIHPNCATSGVLAGLAAWLVMLGSGRGFRKKLDQLATVISAVTIALVIAQPLGPRVQRQFTTNAELGTLHVTTITISERNGAPLHRVHTVD